MAATELSARPEPLLISSDTTAIVVNDMQNAFCSPGGYLDKIGFDLSQAPLPSPRSAASLRLHAPPNFW